MSSRTPVERIRPSGPHPRRTVCDGRKKSELCARHIEKRTASFDDGFGARTFRFGGEPGQPGAFCFVKIAALDNVDLDELAASPGKCADG